MNKTQRHRAKLQRIRERAVAMADIFSGMPIVELSDRKYVVSPAGPWVRL